MTALEWEDKIRKAVEIGLNNIQKWGEPDDSDTILTSLEESITDRLQFIVDSKGFTLNEIQKVRAIWDVLDRVMTCIETDKFRKRYGRGV